MYRSGPYTPYNRPHNTGPMKPRLPMDYGRSLHPFPAPRPMPQPAAPRPVAHIPERPMPNPELGGGVGPMTPRPPHMPGPRQPRPMDPRMRQMAEQRKILQTHDPRLAKKQAMIRLMQQKFRETAYSRNPKMPRPRPRY